MLPRAPVALTLAALLSCTTSGCSKQARPEQPSSAAVKGRVFAVTVGGDLKPARLANVYLLSPELYYDQDSIKNREESVARKCERYEREHSYWLRTRTIPEYPIRRVLSDYRTLLSDYESVLRGRVGPPRGFAAQADEDGWFSFEQILPGSYNVTVFGQAGGNLGFWKSALKLESGQRAEVKLSSPVISCSVL